MPNQRLKTQIIEWLNEKPYWLQYLGGHILENGTITEDLLDSAYLFFKEDVGLAKPELDRPQIEFHEPSSSADLGNEPVYLKSIKNIEFVNALQGDQVIRIGPQLTVIYGGNGAGKSGYIRLLNNAFDSRGDKEILPNVFEVAATGEPECQFTFQRTEEPYDLNFPADSGQSEFEHFCVFDSKCVRSILDEENSPAFTPIGFDFFNTLIIAHDGVKERFVAEMVSKDKPHEFSEMFVNENDVQALIFGLGAATSLSDLEKLSQFSEIENAQKAQTILRLAELNALDKTQAIAVFDQTREQLNEFCRSVSVSFPLVSAEKIESYRKAIEEVKQFEALSRTEGVESLKQHEIANIGSVEWTTFIKAGKAYADTLSTDYPNQEDDKCIFCLQTLDATHSQLIHAYWNLLKGKAAAELAIAKSSVALMLQELRAAPSIGFDDTLSVFEHVNNFDPSLAQRWSGLVSSYKESIAASITALEKLNSSLLPVGIEGDSTEFDPCVAAIQAERAALINTNTTEEIGKLKSQLALFEDQELLGRVKDKVAAYIDTCKWLELARTKQTELTTTGITRKQGALYDEHVTAEYVENFNRECEALGAPSFVNLQQRNERASTLRKLTISDYKAIKVLSEGEQRAISLADFITEASLNPINRGVIFDDPVSSQDHERKEFIAARLVELAKSRQVILFTHDIAFLSRILSLASREAVEVTHNYIKKIGDTPGIIEEDLPWIAKSVKARVGMLKQGLVELKKVEQRGDPDEYLDAAKKWYGQIRDTWERTVDERLFKGVIERFTPGVHTVKLKQVVVTDEMVAEIDKGMTQSSAWLHDAAPGLNPTPPNTVRAEQDLRDLDTFIANCPA